MRDSSTSATEGHSSRAQIRSLESRALVSSSQADRVSTTRSMRHYSSVRGS
jgi:hypothetical protein